MNKTLKNILIVLMALSLAATGLLGVNRARAEREARTVDIVLDYEEFAEMARQSGEPLSQWFSFFAGQGVEHVALIEESFKSLRLQGKPITYATRREFVARSHWDKDLPETLVHALSGPAADDYDLVVETSDGQLAVFIDNGLKTRIGLRYYQVYKNDSTTWFVLDGTIEQALFETGNILSDVNGKVVERPDVFATSMLDRVGIGFDPSKIETIRAGGLEVLPRPVNNPLNPSLALEAFEKDFMDYGFGTNYIIYSGPEVVGYDSDSVMALDHLIQSLERLGLASSLIEAGNQRGHVETRGAEYVAENSHYNLVRVFPVVRYIQKRVGIYNYEGSEEIENTLYRAITERNIRSVYMRPFLENDRVFLTDKTEYERMFTSLSARLADHGLSLGKAGVMAFNHPRLSLIWISAAGLAAASIWLLAQLIRLGLMSGLVLTGIGMVGIAGALFIAPNLATSVLGLAASLIFPAISVYLLVNKLRKLFDAPGRPPLPSVLKQAVWALVLTFGVSLIGGFYIGGFLSSSSYLIEIDYFRGVKLSLGAPVIAAAIFYVLRFGFGRNEQPKEKTEISKGLEPLYWRDILRFLDLKIQVKHLALLAAAGAVAYIYLARSGHETEIQPSDLEMIFRNALEQLFLARPRTKEFLMAYPAVMATVAFAMRKRKGIIFPVLLVASLGYSSVVNTFSHLRTPLYLSTVRELYALGLGIILGTLAVAAVLILDALYAAWQRSREHA
jgi:hypothetical protein